MPLVSMRQLLDEAAKGGYGVGAFNVNNMEQIQSIMEAARETKSPVIVQASRGARAYSQEPVLRIGAGAAAGLNDNRRLGFARRLHDGLNLLHVVDVEGTNAVSALGGLVQ